MRVQFYDFNLLTTYPDDSCYDELAEYIIAEGRRRAGGSDDTVTWQERVRRMLES